jgi:hypothetical protein
MSWVCLEQLEVLSRESLHMPWQFVITTVLEIPPVNSPQSAVKVVIVSKARS